MSAAVRLRGHRSTDGPALRGTWAPGELLGLPLTDRPALLPAVTLEAPRDRTSEVCVAPGAGVVRFSAIDWVHRRARLEIGLADDATALAGPLLHAAIAHGFGVLNLNRLHGWVTPAARPRLDLLLAAGVRREAVVPGAGRFAGETVTREIWGVLRDEPEEGDRA